MKSLSLFKSLRSLVLLSMAVITLNSAQASDADPISDDPFGLDTSIYAELDDISSVVAPRYYSDTYPDLKALCARQVRDSFYR